MKSMQGRLWRAGCLTAVVVAVVCAGCVHPKQCAMEGSAPVLDRPDFEKFTEAEAVQYNQTSKRHPVVYTRLAEYLVERFSLSGRAGIGIDLGGGPGDLILALAARTKQFYWINTDINTWYANSFSENALKLGVGQRTGFVFADACALPFKDGYADLVVSRGAYEFWGNLENGVSEVHRVLKPGGWACIGRGFPPTMPESEVRFLREKAGLRGPKYDPDKDAERFRSIMKQLGVKEYEVIRHKAQDPLLNYGVWLCFQK